MEENTNKTEYGDMENLTGLWKKQSKSGVTYYQGTDKKTGIIYKLFKAEQKSPSSPALNLCCSKPATEPKPAAPQVEDDDIPF